MVNQTRPTGVARLLLSLALPHIGEHMRTAIVRTVHVEPGALLTPGAKLFDVLVDLSAFAPQDCPPVALYRLASREKACLREVLVAPGADVKVGDLLARVTTAADEPLAQEPARALRITVAGIVDPAEWWGTGA